MPEGKRIEYWNLYYPKAAAAGMMFARSAIDPADVLLVHAPPEFLTVEIYNQDGELLAKSKDLKMTADSPMLRLTRRDNQIERQDIWPTKEDVGRVVILPGGEAGILKEWWNAEDKSEWRWEVEFYNHK